MVRKVGHLQTNMYIVIKLMPIPVRYSDIHCIASNYIFLFSGSLGRVPKSFQRSGSEGGQLERQVRPIFSRLQFWTAFCSRKLSLRHAARCTVSIRIDYRVS